MKTAVMLGKMQMELQDAQKPVPGCGELLIRVDYVGICGSDIHLFQTATNGGKDVTEPCILGHEAGGTVEAVGEGVRGFEVGDRVAVEPQKPCMNCEFCKSGRYNLCPDVQFYAAPPTLTGCFAEYIVHPASFCYKLPENVSTLEGALIEPLSVGMHAVRQSGIVPGMSALVIGAGCIGLVTALALKAAGIKRIAIADIMQNRLDFARELGCSDTIQTREQSLSDWVEKNGRFDVVFEAAGRPQTIQEAGLLVKRGGTITLIGYPVERQAVIYVNHLINNEITIKTAFRYRNTYPLAIEMVANGLPLKKIASDIFAFQDVEQALLRAMNCKDQVIKCVVKISTENE